MARQTVYDYIRKKYDILPEFPWRRYGGNAVFRHEDNGKWFALVMEVPADRVGAPGTGYITAVNLKAADPFFRDMVIQEPGIIPAYHMNKQHWITVLLDGTVPDENIFEVYTVRAVSRSFFTCAQTDAVVSFSGFDAQ